MVEPEPVTSVTVPPAEGALDGAWRLLLTLAQDRSMPRWVLIGGLLVELQAHEHAAAPPRLTDDADVLVDVRASPAGLPVVSRWLVEHGLKLDAPDPDGVAHRFRRSDGVTVDLLAPDHVGRRANLCTIPPARTIEAVAGSQLARHTEPVRVTYRDEQGVIQRPTLIATILGKYRAYRRDKDQSTRPAERHLTDVAFLLSLVRDPRRAAAGLSAGDRRYLNGLPEDLEPDSHAWRVLANPADAQSALRLMVKVPRGSR